MKQFHGLRKFVIEYFIILGILVILNVLLMPPARITRDYMILTMAFALAGNLPSLIFWSKSELSQKQYRLRYIIHFITIEVVILTFGGLIGLVSQWPEYVSFAIQILVIYGLVRVVSWRGDVVTANQINAQLKAFQSPSEEQGKPQ